MSSTQVEQPPTTEGAASAAAGAETQPGRGPDARGTDPDIRRARRAVSVKNWLVFLAFVGPNALLILAFVYWPLLANLHYSTLDWRLGARTAEAIGLGNYVRFFTSPEGAEVWRVTITFTVATVIGAMVLGLLVALVLDKRLPGHTVARTGIFAPYVLSGVGVGLVWLFIFDPTLGLLSHVFAFFGQSSPRWFLEPDLALLMVIIVYVWKNLGYCAVVFLAGLQSIPRSLMEAADLDRASAPTRFFRVTLPLLSPTVFFLLITTMLSSMQAFDLLRIMTPTGNGTNTIIFEVWLQSFGAYQRAGYSAAISVVLFVSMLLITTVQMRFVERKVHYA